MKLAVGLLVFLVLSLSYSIIRLDGKLHSLRSDLAAVQSQQVVDHADFTVGVSSNQGLGLGLADRVKALEDWKAKTVDNINTLGTAINSGDACLNDIATGRDAIVLARDCRR